MKEVRKEAWVMKKTMAGVYPAVGLVEGRVGVCLRVVSVPLVLEAVEAQMK